MAFAGLQQRPGLPIRIIIKDFDAQVFAQRRFVVLLVKIGFADHPLGHGGRLGLAAGFAAGHFAVRGAGFVEASLGFEGSGR